MIERISNFPKAYTFFFGLLLCLLAFSIFNLSKVHAAAPTNELPSDIQQILSDYDHNTGGTSTCYLSTNYQNPWDGMWGSQGPSTEYPTEYPNGNPTDDSGLTVAATDKNVSVQLNVFEMNCQRFISPGTCYYPKDLGDSGCAIITSANEAYDYDIVNEKVASGGPAGETFTGPNSKAPAISDNGGTRYWYSKTTGFVYTPPNNNPANPGCVGVGFECYAGTTFNVNLDITVRMANEFYGQWYCTNGGGAVDANWATDSNCNNTRTLPFTITVGKQSCPSGETGTYPTCQKSTPTSCPDQPTESTTPSVTLPQGSEPANTTSSGSPSGVTTSPQPAWYQEIPTGDFDITSAGDQYGTTISWTPGGYSANPFTLNYANYVKDYPYDPHTTTVNYNEEYTQLVWTTQFSGYACAEGTLDGSRCEEVPTCNAKGKDCTQCTPPFVYSGGGCFTGATAEYDWVNTSTSTVVGPSTAYTAPALGECYDRTFTLQPINTSASLSSTTSSDLPSSVTVSGDINSTFGLSGPTTAVRNLCQVSGVTTTFAVYYTTPGDPNPQPLPGGSNSQNGSYAASGSACDGSTETTPVSATFATGIPPLAYGDTVCAYISVTPSGSYMNYAGQITDGNGNLSPGGNGVTATDPSGAPYSFTDCTTALGAEPYFKAIDGDVMAGLDSDYAAGCYDNEAGIYSWNQGGNGSIGAGTTAAALATANNGINQFASGQNILNMLNPPPLTFSNNPATEYGGNYGEGGNCGGPDFYSLAQGLPGAVNCPSVIDNQTVPFAGPGQTITVGLGDKYICYSTSNVTIASNIAYADPPPNTPADDLPVFEVVVKGGNINIDTPFNQGSGTPSVAPVTELFGNYIAEVNNGVGGTISDTGGGNIDVCSASAPGASNDTNNSCTQDRLVIDGSFTANKIDLYRSYGTLHNANTSTTYTYGSSSDPNAAEEFDFGPINWLVPGDDNLTIQSITSLPPVL